MKAQNAERKPGTHRAEECCTLAAAAAAALAPGGGKPAFAAPRQAWPCLSRCCPSARRPGHPGHAMAADLLALSSSWPMAM